MPFEVDPSSSHGTHDSPTFLDAPANQPPPPSYQSSWNGPPSYQSPPHIVPPAEDYQVLRYPQPAQFQSVMDSPDMARLYHILCTFLACISFLLSPVLMTMAAVLWVILLGPLRRQTKHEHLSFWRMNFIATSALVLVWGFTVLMLTISDGVPILFLFGILLPPGIVLCQLLITRPT